MTNYIGLDIGATNIRIGAMNEKEEVLFSYEEVTLTDIKTDIDLLNKIIRLIEMVPDYQKCLAIGIGIPGSIDKSENKIVGCKYLPMLIGFPLVSKLTQHFNKAVYIENDARIAGISEAIKGSGKNKGVVCYVTISTGIGGSIIIDRNIYRGANNLGGYFARMILNGKDNAVTLISGSALGEQAKEMIDESISSAKELFELFEKGNIKAIEIIEEFKRNLVTLLINISITINPDVIILGGGVMKSKNLFLNDVINDFKDKAHILAKNTLIETSSLNDPGIIGAALFAKEEYNQDKKGDL